MLDASRRSTIPKVSLAQKGCRDLCIEHRQLRIGCALIKFYKIREAEEEKKSTKYISQRALLLLHGFMMFIVDIRNNRLYPVACFGYRLLPLAALQRGRFCAVCHFAIRNLLDKIHILFRRIGKSALVPGGDSCCLRPPGKRLKEVNQFSMETTRFFLFQFKQE